MSVTTFKDFELVSFKVEDDLERTLYVDPMSTDHVLLTIESRDELTQGQIVISNDDLASLSRLVDELAKIGY